MSLFKKLKKKFKILKTLHRQGAIVNALRNKVKSGEKIRIGFYVVYDSVFPAEPVFQNFLNDPMFEPFILVIPDVARGEDNMFWQMDKTYKSLSSKYKNVYKSYDEKTKSFIDFKDKTDLIFFANPYDSMTHEYYRIENNEKSDKLTMYTHYGYQISNSLQYIFNTTAFNMFWKIFLLNNHEKKLLRKNVNFGRNGTVVGYCKLDEIAKIKTKSHKRKKIIIAPHHTVMEWKNGLELSTFMTYHEFFLKLFKKYPNIDFVFRPHPLLWINLENNKIWNKKQIDTYIKKVQSFKNVEFQNGGAYLDTFVNSDALIHDCGSFSAEYLFVNKPCCFLLKNQKMLEQNSNAFHKQCLDLHYSAYNEQEIIDFIENVVLQNQDSKSADREAFVKKELAFEYPHVAKKIYETIKQEFIK